MVTAAEAIKPPSDFTTTPPARPSTPHYRPLDVGQWLVNERNATTTPDEITTKLIASGWDADTAARTSLRSLRSSDRHTLTYAALNICLGLAALGLATSLHMMIQGNLDPYALTWMLTLTIVTAPIAGVSGYFAHRAEKESDFVMWSPSRRGWFGALAVCTGSIGLIRLIIYVYDAIATLTGASVEKFSLESASQVVVSLAISIPLFVWSFIQWRRSNLVISALTKDDSTNT